MADFSKFTKEYGTPTDVEKPGKKLIDEYRGRLPDELLEFWEQFGFGNYGNGLLWVVDPRQLEEPLAEWVPAKKKQKPIAVMRTAFGKIIYWHDGGFALLNPLQGERFEIGDSVPILFGYFLLGDNAKRGILRKTDFDKALKKFGPLQKDEIYGYKLPLAMGGDDSIKNMDKMKMREHLSILAQAQE